MILKAVMMTVVTDVEKQRVSTPRRRTARASCALVFRAKALSEDQNKPALQPSDKRGGRRRYCRQNCNHDGFLAIRIYDFEARPE
jgi:hypothetical protein